MSNESTQHATLVLERVYPTSPHRVFGAYADVEVRARWGAPSDTEAIVYSEAHFTVGGSDSYRCGPKSDLPYRGTVRYEDIVTDRRIVFTETIQDADALLSISLITWEIFPEQSGTRLVVTDQIVSFAGAAMVAGSEAGTNAALDNLGTWLERQPSLQEAPQ